MWFLSDLARQQQIVYARGDTHRLPPQLQALPPPRDPGNPQRLILSRLLSREINVAGMKPLDQKWRMLTFAGHGGIGHIDVFKTDELAGQYYARSGMAPVNAKAGIGVWSAFRRLALEIATEQDEDVVLDAIGPTPAVSGFVPKLVVSIQIVNGQWRGAMGGPDAAPALVHWSPIPD